MYETETRAITSEHQRPIDLSCYLVGQRHPVHLRLGYGNCLSPWIVGKTSGQPRDIQNAFTRFFYSYRRHDWIPEWYQTDGK